MPVKSRFFKPRRIAEDDIPEPVPSSKPRGIKKRVVTEMLEKGVSKNKNLKSKPITVAEIKSKGIKKRLTPEEYLKKNPDLQKNFNSTVDMLFQERRTFGAPSVCVLTKYFNDIQFSDDYSGILQENCLKEFPEYGPVFGIGKFPVEEKVSRKMEAIPEKVQPASKPTSGSNAGGNKGNSGQTAKGGNDSASSGARNISAGKPSTKKTNASKSDNLSVSDNNKPGVNTKSKGPKSTDSEAGSGKSNKLSSVPSGKPGTEKPAIEKPVQKADPPKANGNKVPKCTKCGKKYKGLGPRVCIKCNIKAKNESK